MSVPIGKTTDNQDDGESPELLVRIDLRGLTFQEEILIAIGVGVEAAQGDVMLRNVFRVSARLFLPFSSI
jgi:hypothetical protein